MNNFKRTCARKKPTFIILPPIIVSSYSSPNEKVLTEFETIVLVFTVHFPSFTVISMVGEEEVIIFLAIHGTPIEK